MTAVPPDLLPRLGGVLCLDFVNTIDPWYGDDRVEYLVDYPSLVEWALWAGALPAGRRDELLAADDRDADVVFQRARALRDELHVLLGPQRRSPVTETALSGFNRELRRLAGHAELRSSGGRYAARWDGTATPEAVLWPVVESATALMLSPRVERVRECDGHDCGWLFLDTSKAGRRRWCSMEICGNRAKSQRYRSRARAAGR
jgi:predicted RNA-binding Zn ribbon-like protein